MLPKAIQTSSAFCLEIWRAIPPLVWWAIPQNFIQRQTKHKHNWVWVNRRHRFTWNQTLSELSIQVKIKRGQERATDLPAWVCTSKQDAKRKQRTYKEWKKGLISKELSLPGQTVEMKLKLPGGQENGNSQRKLNTNKKFLNRKEQETENWCQ